MTYHSMPLTIAVIAGTTRVKRESIKAARYIADFAAAIDDVNVIFVDPVEFPMAGDGNDPESKNSEYTKIVEKADAFFIVTPEYNHSFPGSLKRLLDSELALYNHKPVAFAGVSSGHWGGVRAVEALVPAVRETGLVVMSWDVYFPNVQDLFDDAGKIKPEHAARYEKQLHKLFAELLWFAKILKQNSNA